MKNWMRQTVLLLLAGLVAGLLLTGCEDEEKISKDSYYISQWDQGAKNVLLLKADGTYSLTAGQSGDNGTYTLEKHKLAMTSAKGGNFTQILKDDYVLAYAYDGDMPDADTFAQTFVQEATGYSVVMEFCEDGTMNRRIRINGLMDTRIRGTYQREGDIITCDCEVFGTFVFVVHEGTLYDAYRLDPDYTPPTATPTAETTAAPMPETTETPTAETPTE